MYVLDMLYDFCRTPPPLVTRLDAPEVLPSIVRTVEPDTPITMPTCPMRPLALE